MSRCDHPGYFAFIPACGTFPGRARGLHRERAEHLRRLVDGGGRAEPAGAARARPVQAMDRLPRAGRRRARERRLGGEHDRARLRARGAAPSAADEPSGDASRTCPIRRIRRSRAPRVRSACGPTSCACCPATSGTGCASTRWPARSPPTCGGPAAVLRGRLGGVDEHRRDRPAAGAGRDLPRGRGVAARRRRVRRVRGADRARDATGWRASSWPTR